MQELEFVKFDINVPEHADLDVGRETFPVEHLVDLVWPNQS